MHLLTLNSSSSAKKNRVLTIGNYDGVHQGHQQLLKHCLVRAQEKQALAAVLVFEPHPQAYFKQPHLAQPLLRITNFKERYNQLKAQGMEELICCPFNQRLANLSPLSFVKEILCTQLKMIHLIVGEDFHFGKHRAGNVALLHQLSSTYHFTVECIETICHQQKRISSSLIRQYLIEGDFAKANEYLGRAFYLEGKVIHGQKRARTLGFPTANIHLKNQPQLLRGVYLVDVMEVGKDKLYPSIANIGVRPTVEGKQWLLEVHLLNQVEINLYGKQLRVIFKQKLRDERRFKDLIALKNQVTQDIAHAKVYNNLFK